ncbi:MAG: hypothetical protein PHS62_01230 [Patescibacteria group bacterium]|nr:hypothetical protein [Patescibacteria group bacterium]
MATATVDTKIDGHWTIKLDQRKLGEIDAHDATLFDCFLQLTFGLTGFLHAEQYDPEQVTVPEFSEKDHTATLHFLNNH